MALQVKLFITCIVDQIFPQVGIAMADVLERAGCELDFPEAQTCCGQPAFNSGYWREARKVAEHFLKVFRGTEPIVVPSGSCASMISHHFGDLFDGDPLVMEQVHDIERRTWEFSKFLLEYANVEDLGARFEHVATYHDSCHGLRELGIKAGPRLLLSHVRGLTLKEMEYAEECCGFGGTFSVKFPDVSGGMARTKIRSIVETGAEYVISGDCSCLMQIQGTINRNGHGVKTIHLAEVLASR